MKKRVMAAFLAMAIMLCQFAFAAAQETETGSNSLQTDAIRLIKDLGILTLSEYEPDSVIQRRDLAEIIAKCMVVENSEDYENVFNDVSEDDAKAGYIFAAYKLGVMSGYFDGTFNPFRTVTYNEAVKTFIFMAGYSDYAERKGGWPFGYHKVAGELKINRGINAVGDEVISLGELSLMLQRTLELDMMDAVLVVGDEVQYGIIKEKNLLLQNMEISVISGRLTANYLTSLTGSSSLEKNEVKVDETTYVTAVADLPSLLGRNLIYYIKEISGRDTIIAYREQEKDSTEITLYAEDIVSVSHNEVSYLDADGDEETMELYEGADFIYNGAAKISWSPAEINMSGSQARFLDSDGDGKYDVIFVNRFINLIVNSYAEIDDVIRFKTSGSEYQNIKLSSQPDIRYELLDAEGNEVALKDLKEWDILSVAKSIDEKVYIMRLGNGFVTGTCATRSDDEVKIDETVYMLDKEINEPFYSGTIEIGKKGVFYLDFRNRVTAVSYDSSILTNYAYLMGIDKKKNSFAPFQIKLFGADGKISVYTVAEKLKVNGAPADAEDIMTDYRFVIGGLVVNQLVTYETNADGEICELSVAENGGVYSSEEERSQVFTLDDQFASIQCRKGNMNMFASRYFLTDATKVFVVPEDVTDEKHFYILGLSNLITDFSYSNVKLYDIDPNSKISVVVIGYNEDMFKTTSRLVGAVMDKAAAIDSEGNPATRITLHRGGTSAENLILGEDIQVVIETNAIVDMSLVNYKTENGTNYISPDEIQTGDIIEYIKDKNSKITVVYLLYRRGTGTLKEVSNQSISEESTYSARSYSFVEIVKLLDKAVRINVPSRDGTKIYERAYPILNNTLLLKYNGERNRMDTISWESIEVGDRAFIYAQSSSVRIIIIY